MVLSWLLGSDEDSEAINQINERLDSIESRLSRLESDAVRESDIELLRNEVEELREGKSSVSKQEKVRSRILELADEGLEKSSIKEKITEKESLCSESYFYENWNYLLDAGFLSEEEGDVSILIEEPSSL